MLRLYCLQGEKRKRERERERERESPFLKKDIYNYAARCFGERKEIATALARGC
jgi:hypothetical protein